MLSEIWKDRFEEGLGKKILIIPRGIVKKVLDFKEVTGEENFELPKLSDGERLFAANVEMKMKERRSKEYFHYYDFVLVKYTPSKDGFWPTYKCDLSIIGEAEYFRITGNENVDFGDPLPPDIRDHLVGTNIPR